MSYVDSIQRAPVIWHESEPYIHRGYALGVAERASLDATELSQRNQHLRKAVGMYEQSCSVLHDQITALKTELAALQAEHDMILGIPSRPKYENGIDYVPVRRGDLGMAEA